MFATSHDRTRLCQQLPDGRQWAYIDPRGNIQAQGSQLQIYRQMFNPFDHGIPEALREALRMDNKWI